MTTNSIAREQQEMRNPVLTVSAIATVLSLAPLLYGISFFSIVAMDKAVIDHGPFIFVPLIFVTIIILWISFAKHTAKKYLSLTECCRTVRY